MTGVLQAVAAGGGGPNRGFVPWDVNANAAVGVSSGGALIFNLDGTVTKVINAGTSKGTDGSAYWWAPPQPNVGSGLYIRSTVSPGTLDGGTSGAWALMSSYVGLGFYQAISTSDQSATVKFDIATDAAGANIIFTSTGNIIRRTHG